MPGVTRYAQRERAVLADLLATAGPDAPTLCTGWTTRDLAAHVVVREHRPDAAVGIIVKAMHGWGERVRLSAAARPWESLIDEVRRAPWWSHPAIDEQINTIEYFVHVEDVRRATGEWEPRELPEGLERALWSRLGGIVRLIQRRVKMPIRIVAPGHGEVTAGTGAEPVTLTGPPSELMLFFTGRQRVAQLTVEGPEAAVERLSTARLGI